MELALLVYAVSLLDGISSLCVSVMVVCGALLFLSLLYLIVFGDEISFKKGDDSWHWKNIKRIWWIAGIFLVIGGIGKTITPNEKTAYVMIGAYATQQLASSETATKVGGKVLTVINQKLDSYISEGEKALAATVEKKAVVK
jgi:hypothetical protein